MLEFLPDARRTGSFPRLFAAVAAGSLGFFGSVAAMAEEAPEFPPGQIEFFEKEIRPLLAESCLDCHSGLDAKVGLQLDRRAGWIKGSDYRAVVDLETPEKSLLVRAVRHAGGKDVPSMPEKGAKLSDEQVGKLVRWIGAGLPWPEEEGKEPVVDPTRHWSFQPVEAPELPADAGHPVDWFLASAREEAEVVPAPLADRRTLYRRAHFDLLGLPPKFEEQEKFVNDPRPDDEAWAALIDHLLGSPHYGERWARHWMDVARYSDTKGYEAGGRERRFVYSYTYRDWLIRAFNEDLPFDQFALYQLAADQLVDWEAPEKRHLAAMGFLSLSKNGREELVLDDRLDTTFRGLMGLTVSCARCHDHKFDPVSTKEYYGLYGVFKNSMEQKQPTIGEEESGPEYEKYRAELAKKQKKVDDFLEPKLAELAKKFPDLANRRFQLVRKLERGDRRKMQNLQKQVDKFVADSRMEPDKALVLTDREKAIQQQVFVRGNPSRRGEVAPARFLSVLARDGEARTFEKGSGRLEMAHEIANAANPMTARVIVNRVWAWHFGEGIVRSVSDFGTQGEAPDHPELLDWLARWFVDEGWSLKKLHKLLLTSRTWRQQSTHPRAEEMMLVDAENRLLWHHNRKRLSLEQMRDGMLDVAGNLSNEMFGRAVKVLEPPYSNRRSVYAFIDRQNLNPVFRNFDFSNPQETTGRRPRTTIPMQALFTLNSDFVQDQAALLAEKAVQAVPDLAARNPEFPDLAEEVRAERVAYLHRAVYAREPSGSDLRLAADFLSAFEENIGDYAERQTDHEWSYGWGGLDAESGETVFQPMPHWTGQQWQMDEEWPVPDGPFRYLRIEEKGKLHPGRTSSECAIIQWRAPEDLRVAVRSVARRHNVGKGNGVRVKIVSSRDGLLLDKVLDASKENLRADLAEVKVRRGDRLWFLLDSHEGNTSFDSTEWDPRIVDLDGKHPAWVMSESFSGPAVPASAWSAYAHALLNTNRFLFVE